MLRVAGSQKRCEPPGSRNPHGRVKVEIGVARGKQQHDKRRDIADRDAKRDMERQMADAKGRDRY